MRQVVPVNESSVRVASSHDCLDSNLNQNVHAESDSDESRHDSNLNQNVNAESDSDENIHAFQIAKQPPKITNFVNDLLAVKN